MKERLFPSKRSTKSLPPAKMKVPLSVMFSAIAYTAGTSESSQVAAFKEGASGYITKDSSGEKIIASILEAAAGGMLMPAKIATKVRGFLEAKKCPLTKRQFEILTLMAEGFSHKEIACQLHISHHTVDTHLQNIYSILHVKSAPAAISKAFRNKWFF